MSNGLTAKNQPILYRLYFPDDENTDGSLNIGLCAVQPHDAAWSPKPSYCFAGIDRLSVFAYQNTTKVLFTITFIRVLCEVRNESAYLVLLLRMYKLRQFGATAGCILVIWRKVRLRPPPKEITETQRS